MDHIFAEELAPLLDGPDNDWLDNCSSQLYAFYQGLCGSERFKAAVQATLVGLQKNGLVAFRHTVTFNIALNQFIYVIYAVLYFAAAVRSGIDYASHYVQLMIVLAIMIALPGVYGQWSAYQSILSELLEGKKVTTGALYSKAWFAKYNTIANSMSTAIIGWNLVQELSSIWRSTVDEQSVAEYWSDSISYLWRLPFALLMFLLMFYYNRYYLGSTKERAKSPPCNSFLAPAFMYAIGNYFMTVMPIMRFFLQKMKAGEKFNVADSDDLEMIIHLIISAITSLPLRTMMYSNFFREKHDEAQSKIAPFLGRETINAEASGITLGSKKIPQLTDRKAASAFAIATSAGQCYLSILGTRAVFHDAIPQHVRSNLIESILETYIIANNAMATGIGPCLRYHSKWVLR